MPFLRIHFDITGPGNMMKLKLAPSCIFDKKWEKNNFFDRFSKNEKWPWLRIYLVKSYGVLKVFIFRVILVRIFPYSVRMRENTDQSNSKYGHFSRSVIPNKDFKLTTQCSREMRRIPRFLPAVKSHSNITRSFRAIRGRL